VDTKHHAAYFFGIKQNGIKAQSDFIHTMRSHIYINIIMAFSDKHRITILTFYILDEQPYIGRTIILTYMCRMTSLIYAGSAALLYTNYPHSHCRHLEPNNGGSTFSSEALLPT